MRYVITKRGIVRIYPKSDKDEPAARENARSYGKIGLDGIGGMKLIGKNVQPGDDKKVIIKLKNLARKKT